MQRFFENKRFVSLVAILGLVGLILLAGAIRDIDLRPGTPLGRPSFDQSIRVASLGDLVKQAAEVPFWKQAAFLGFLFVVVLLAASLLNPELRKKLILAFIRFAILVFVVLALIENNPELYLEILDQFTLPASPSISRQVTDIPAPVFQPPQFSRGLTFLISFGLVSASILFLWRLGRSWDRVKQLFFPPPPLDGIGHVARTSLGKLQSGGNFENVIIECYARMSAVLVEKKGLQREVAMTPDEFAGRLTRAGLPRSPVNTLTRLFEEVRYGGQPPGQHEIQEAMTSLTTIMRHCGEDV